MVKNCTIKSQNGTEGLKNILLSEKALWNNLHTV